MAEGNTGLQDLLTSLSPLSGRSYNLANTSQTSGHEASSGTDNQPRGNHAMISPLPKRTQSEQYDQSSNLLNLLHFDSLAASRPQSSTPNSSTRSASQVNTQNIHGRGVSSSDLVASYMGKPTIAQMGSNTTPSYMPDVQGGSANPQDYLLQLLNRSSHSQGRTQPQKNASSTADIASPLASDSSRKTSIQREATVDKESRSSPIRVFGSQASRETTPFEPTMTPKATTATEPEKLSEPEPAPAAIFNYVNPFEQLAANSPLKGRSGTVTPAAEAQEKFSTPLLRSNLSVQASPAPAPAKSMLDTNGHEILQSIEGSNRISSPTGSRLADIGAPTSDKATVAQALNEVGARVHRQMEHALAQTSIENNKTDEKFVESIEVQLQKAAAEAKEEIEANGLNASTALVRVKNTEHDKDTINEASVGNVGSHYESADDEGSSGRAEEEIDVPVYSFPMRPFVSIDIQGGRASSLSFRDISITDIARLKKEFDQVDRILATASNNYIVYALPKPGGIRIIRQDDGMDRQAFKETKDHVFNVAISNEAHNRKHKTGLETCIATAISGNVYWLTLRKGGEDILVDPDFQHHSLVFSPMLDHEDNTSGGQLKTRAKKSNRHPDCFAIGRGKAVHIVYPQRALSSQYVSEAGVVNTARYFKDFLLKIDIGKAGKDFTFSEDDTVLATLDKAGKLRLWDATRLVDDAYATSPSYNVRLDKPVLTFLTTLGTTKSWPTSVLFVDKPRAYTKSCAQRYVIVGLKQNHTLQLWDLGLGKAVQELNFPHEKESDAICSISYHHHAGIVVVGHPTRNSIYFIHLSAPKYNLSIQSQASFIQSLAKEDHTLPKPESTAIMSDIREYSFASKGQLRSVEILPVTADGSADPDRGLFELYVMHSKGVTCLNIRKADLGWSEDNKIINAKSAEDESFIIVKDIRAPIVDQPNINQISEVSSANDEHTNSTTTRPQVKSKKSTDAASKLDSMPGAMAASENAKPDQPQEKAERKSKKRRTAPHLVEEAAIPPPAPVPPATVEQPEPSIAQSRDAPATNDAPISSSSTSQQVPEARSEPAALPEKQQLHSDEVLTALQGEFQSLGVQLKAEYNTLDENVRERQKEVLRLVSEQLGTNVEKTLSRIVMTNITNSVLPAIRDSTASVIREDIPNMFSKHLQQTLPIQLKASLPEAMMKTMSSPDIIKLISDQVTTKVSNQLNQQLGSTLQNAIVAWMETNLTQSIQKQMAESEQRINNQIQQLTAQHNDTMTKIDKLTSLVQNFSDAIQTMAASQTQVQSEVVKSQGHSRKESAMSAVSSEARSIQLAPIPEPLPEQEEIKLINEAMLAGNYEHAIITWLHSNYQSDIFDEYYVHYEPHFLRGCSSLISLSVIAPITNSLTNNVPQRLHWLEIVLDFVDPQDTDIREVAPKIMDVLCQRLETRFKELSDSSVEPYLRKFPPIIRKARALARSFQDS